MVFQFELKLLRLKDWRRKPQQNHQEGLSHFKSKHLQLSGYLNVSWFFFNAINHMHDIGFKIIASHSISQKQGPKSKPLPKRNIVKPELTTTSKQRPPVYNGHHFLVPILDFIT